jgi:hypothetical protein
MQYPLWLPPIISVDGEWETVLQKLYLIFNYDFKENLKTLNDLPVWYDRNKKDGLYEEGFWHLITKTDHSSDSKERLFDQRRAERLPWCGPTISNAADIEVKVWDYLEGRMKTNTYLWLEKWNYIIILEKRKLRRGNVYFLKTAYHVQGASTQRKLHNKYNNRIC